MNVPRAGRREWAALGILALPTMVLSMDLTVLHLAAPSMSADLAPSGTQLLWILDVYGFLMAGFLLVMGPLGDRIGRRRLLLIGAVAFTAASLLAAYASSPETLIAARALLGVAAATLMPSTLALLTDLFRAPDQRALAIALWMVAFTGGEALGPLVGGILLEFLWWGSVFLIAVPVMILLLALAPFLIPESTERTPGRLDPLSVTMLLAAVLASVYGVKEFAAQGSGVTPGVWLLVGVVSGVLFVRRQSRLTDPVVDPALFRSPAFSAGVGVQMLAVAAMAGGQLLTLQYLQSVLGLTPFEAGLWTVPSVILGVAATLLVPRLTRRVRPAHVVAGSLFAAAVGSTLLAATVPREDLLWTVVGFTVLYVGVTPTLVLTTDLVVGSVPRERAGTAAGVSESGAELGLSGGMALIGAAVMSVYGSRVSAGAPEGVSEERSMEASETVGQGVAVAESLGGESGDALMEVVRSAFAEGLRVATATGAVILLIAVVLALVFLRTVPSTGGVSDESEPGRVDG